MKDLFSRNVPGTTEILQKSCIGIAGCGGLGSNAAIALVRSGAGNLIIVDYDIVEESNLNRQQFFYSDTGKKKVEALSFYLKAINPRVNVISHDCEITPQNVAALFGSADLLVEAFDRAERKKWLIESWSRAFPNKPIICGNGLSGVGHIEDLKITKIGNIYFCGDGKTDMSMGLCAPRVAIVANMEACMAIEVLVNSYK
ncbi:MAG TPA: sulfur carrier protein ThiS adenylyltransferase ThiF [Candidatus Eremiobacteraeota bacterium]|nr:MAG: Molybdopterin-synthase adenylyltransferase [bacterium ADurb.Bin363]HPZ08224.1 sulfur carrier protein ThiS adenylyltransferase ThiF [Candidatus Eremiobacteraeota bacterium]